MHILAIDPGPIQSAWCLYDCTENKPLAFNICPNEEFPKYFEFGWRLVVVVVIEKIASYGMTVGETVFTTCFWAGRLAERCLSNQDVLLRMLERRKVKLHLCGSMRAKDTNVRQVLIDKFGAPGTKKKKGLLYGVKKDMWAALALAVTFAETYENETTFN